MVWLRRAYKFVSLDGSQSYTFSGAAANNQLINYSFADAQRLRASFAPAIGADYPFDFLGSKPAPKDAASDRITLLVSAGGGGLGTTVDGYLDTMRQQLWRIGQGKLYTTDDNAVDRWAYARLVAMPAVTVKNDTRLTIAAAFEFTRLSDWMSATATTGTVAITANGQTFTLTNPGTAIVRLSLDLTLSGTFNNPKFTNQTISPIQSIGSTRTSALTTNWLDIDCERYRMRWSTNSGSTYADDYANSVIPAGQVPFLELLPGANTILYNDANTTLNGAITNVATSLVVASAAGFPTSGNFTIIIDSEQMTVTAGQGTTTWTVTRAVNGTTAAAHSNGAVVAGVPVASLAYAFNGPWH